MATSTGERLSRRELLETIDKQNEQLGRYETRLRDVVRAYKGLAKEKEALEKSFSALSGPKDESDSKQETPDPDGPLEQHTDNESMSSGGETGPPDVKSLKSKVRTLAASLSTLSMEKSRLETQFQESKKRAVNEKRDFEKKIEVLTHELNEAKANAKKEVDEVKSKWIVERHNREKESNDHGLMLRELQKLVADERTSKEKLEQELGQARDNLKALELAGTFNTEYEKRVRELETQLSEKTSELEAAKSKAIETPPELLKLRKEMSELESKHVIALQTAEQRSREIEERSSNLRATQEQRVVNLESRLQELSDTVGSYDRLRQQDQVSIQKLRERVQQLDQEKNAYLERLSSGNSSPSASPPGHTISAFGDEDSNLDVQTLIERILRLKAMVRDANRRSKHPIDLDELFEIDNEAATRWKKSFYQLKDEFDSFKLKKDLIVNTSQVDTVSRRLIPTSAELDEEEIQNLKSQINELKNRLSSIQNQLEQSRHLLTENEKKEMELQESLGSQRQMFKEKLEKQEQDLTGKIVELESELQKQRDRCLALIEEKEDEIASLKSSVAIALEAAITAAAMPIAGNAKTVSPTSLQREAQLRVAAALAHGGSCSRPRLLSTASTADPFVEEVTENLTHLANHQSDGMVLHYSQELSRCEVEITNLRKKNYDLESAMRELQMSFGAKEERYYDEIDQLKDAVRRLKRMTTAEGANFEYLKNVVLNYMLSSDAASRDHMLKAIGAVLTFTDAEVQRVRAYNASWWGSSTTTTASTSRRLQK